MEGIQRKKSEIKKKEKYKTYKEKMPKMTNEESEVESLISEAMSSAEDFVDGIKDLEHFPESSSEVMEENGNPPSNKTGVKLENINEASLSEENINSKCVYISMCDDIITNSIEVICEKMIKINSDDDKHLNNINDNFNDNFQNATMFDFKKDSNETMNPPNNENLANSRIDLNFINSNDTGESEEKFNIAENFDLSPDSLSMALDNIIPSAPAMVQSIICTNTYPVKQDVNTSIPEISNSVTSISALLTNNEEFKPFTPAQLAALYRNRELELNEKLVSDFIDQELKSGHEFRHPLYDLLLNYLRSRGKINKNKLELENMKKNSAVFQNSVWALELARISETGECQDGNPVVGTYEYRVSRMNEIMFSKVSHILHQTREVISQVLSLNIFSCEVLRLKIEHTIQSIISHFSFLDHNTVVSLLPESSPLSHQINHIIVELRNAISVLFAFQRQAVMDDGFTSFIRNHLSQLVAILVRVATWRDHLFILNHVLRCPAGFGSWAVSYIQLPVPLYNSRSDHFYLDHFIAVLAGILLPINERDQFLSKMHLNESDGDNDAPWVFINEDGDDDTDQNSGANNKPSDALKESDCIALLNQIPFDEFFRQLLLIERRDGNDVYDPSNVSDRDILQMLAISSLVIGLLECGMANFGAPRYKQFVKRLGRLAVHIVEYASDHWNAYRVRSSTKTVIDTGMLSRIQIEYDGFFKRSFLCLFNNQVTWQFLTALPYNMLSIHTLYKLFLLIVPSSNNLPDPEAFEETLLKLPDENIIYLLTTIANMSSARTFQDWIFIKSSALLLLQVGFLSSQCRDKCSKVVRNLFSGLTAKFPNLVSEFILFLQNHFYAARKFTLSLFNALSLEFWKPNDTDLIILRNWLLHNTLVTCENNLARFILDRLNYGFDSSNQNLFLPYNVHRQIAVLVVKTVALYAPETSALSGTIMLTEGMKQVSSIVKSPTPEQILVVWAWRVLLKLHLHLLDQSDASVCKTVVNVCQAASSIPNLDSSLEEIKCLAEGVSKQQSIACFASLMMTSIGHSIPLICNEGFSNVIVLINVYQYTPALISLELIFPLFIESAPSLYASQRFQDILLLLMSADRSYLKTAKNLIYSNFPGLILTQFGDLISYHLQNHHRYALNSSGPLIELWLNCLLSVWKIEPNSTIYLISILLKTAFFDANMRLRVIEILTEFYKTLYNGQSSSNSLSFLVSWVSSNAQSYPSLLPRNISQPEISWYILFALDIEETVIQRETKLWPELLQALAASSSKKTSIDNCLKKVCSNLKIPCLGSSMLSIYRWSQFALDLPCNDPVLPLLWQRFFALYLARVPGSVDRGSVGFKFFEGITNQMYLKKVKKKLQDCIDYHNSQLSDLDLPLNLQEFHENLAGYYRTLTLWLEESRLQETSLFLPAFPPNYNTHKLSLILAENTTYWIEFVNVSAIERGRKECAARWVTAKNRSKENISDQRSMATSSDDDPEKRILKRLKSYDTPVTAPPLQPCQQVIPFFPRESLLNKSVMLEVLEKPLKSLEEYSASYSSQMNQYTTLDSKYLKAIAQLYKDVEKEIVLKAACDTVSPSRKKVPANLHCAGPATIRLMVREAQLNPATDLLMKSNRRETEGIIKSCLFEPPSQLCVAAIFVENAVKALEKEFLEVSKIGDVRLMTAIKDVGIVLFYHFVHFYDDDAFSFAPSRQLFLDIIHMLGQCFIDNEESECSKVLDMVLKKPHCEQLLTSHFTPLAASVPAFLLMYRTICDTVNSSTVELCFSLLSKFDIQQWLVTKKPRLSERSQLLDLIYRSLANFGTNPSRKVALAHELYRKHLCVILAYDFPEHYGEILHSVLTLCADDTISCDVWFSILNTLIGSSQNVLQPDLPFSQLKDVARKYATEQHSFSYQELAETVILLSNHFMKERIKYGLYGLYPRYRKYIESFSAFFTLISHALIVSVVQNNQGALADKLCEQLWPQILNLFSPWLSPYFTSQLSEPTPAWIQQLTDDRSVLPPFISADSSLAAKMTIIFVECIKFIFEILPNNSVILSFVLKYYATSFANTSVKEFVLQIIHDNFISLPWQKYIPSVHDMELMMKIVDQYLPNCHTFLGAIFIEIQWHSIVNYNYPVPISTKMHSILLHLLIKLANEPNVRNSDGRITLLLMEARKFHWYLIDANCYQNICNWFVMSYDARVILQLTDQDFNAVDLAALELLQISAGYVPEAQFYHTSTSIKRQLFVRSNVKMILQLMTRYKSVAQNRKAELKLAFNRMLDRMESVVSKSVPPENQVGEVGLLLAEFFALVNQPSGTVLCNISSEVLINWVQAKSCNCIVLQGILRVAGTSITNDEVLGNILECCCISWFKFNKGGAVNQDWESLLQILQPISPRSIPIEKMLLANGHLLTLFGLTLKSIPTPQDLSEELVILNKIILYVSSIKPSKTSEIKTVLFWSLALRLCSNQITPENSSSEKLALIIERLHKLVAHANLFAEQKSNWGILGAIGIVKQNSNVNRFRLLSRAFATYILAQIPERDEAPSFIIRNFANAPGIITDTSGDLAPSVEALKSLNCLESLLLDKTFADMKNILELSISMIKSPENSLDNGDNFILSIARLLFNDGFIHASLAFLNKHI